MQGFASYLLSAPDLCIWSLQNCLATTLKFKFELGHYICVSYRIVIANYEKLLRKLDTLNYIYFEFLS